VTSIVYIKKIVGLTTVTQGPGLNFVKRAAGRNGGFS
jgi:hypothetical protein